MWFPARQRRGTDWIWWRNCRVPVTSAWERYFLRNLFSDHSPLFFCSFSASGIKQRLEMLKCNKKSCSPCIFWPDLKKGALDISRESLFESYCCWLSVIDMGAEPSKHFTTNKSYNECCHFCTYELSRGRLENSQIYLLFTVIHELFKWIISSWQFIPVVSGALLNLHFATRPNFHNPTQK